MIRGQIFNFNYSKKLRKFAIVVVLKILFLNKYSCSRYFCNLGDEHFDLSLVILIVVWDLKN